MSKNPFLALIKNSNSQKSSAQPTPAQPTATADTTRAAVNPASPSPAAARVNPLLALGNKKPAVPVQREVGEEPKATPSATHIGSISTPANSALTGLSILNKLAAKNQVPAANVEAQKQAMIPSRTAIATVAAAPLKSHVDIDESAPMGMAERLDELDRLIMRDNGISAFTLDAIRGHVKIIMIQLKEEPELDAILIDRDIHNVLSFIRHVRVDAMAAQTVKAEKATVKSRKGGVGKIKFDMTKALGSLDGDLGNLQNLGKLKL